MEERLKRGPIARFPTWVKVVEFTGRKSRVVQHNHGFGTLRFQFKLYDRIKARVPMGGTPCLDNSLAGEHFDVSSNDHAVKHGKSAALLWVDLCWHAGEGGELLRVRERLVKPLGCRVKLCLLVKGGPSIVDCGVRRVLRGLLFSFPPNLRLHRHASQCDGGAGDGLPACQQVELA